MSEKNGGPYTKPEQEKRRRQVYEMHFEKSQSASHIAEELDVNRNTISEDIKYWYSELASEFDEFDVKNLMLKQHSRMESQRTRLVQMLEKEQNINNVIKIEKMIFDLDCAITKMIAPIAKMQAQSIPDDIVIQTVEHLLSGDDARNLSDYSDGDMLRNIISYRKCDVSYAQKILDRIKLLGLGLFKNRDYTSNADSYNMLEFAKSRKILSDDKLQAVHTRIRQQREEERRQMAEMERKRGIIEKQFVEKYGDQSEWTEQIWDKFQDVVDP